MLCFCQKSKYEFHCRSKSSSATSAFAARDSVNGHLVLGPTKAIASGLWHKSSEYSCSSCFAVTSSRNNLVLKLEPLPFQIRSFACIEQNPDLTGGLVISFCFFKATNQILTDLNNHVLPTTPEFLVGLFL